MNVLIETKTAQTRGNSDRVLRFSFPMRNQIHRKLLYAHLLCVGLDSLDNLLGLGSANSLGDGRLDLLLHAANDELVYARPIGESPAEEGYATGQASLGGRKLDGDGGSLVTRAVGLVLVVAPPDVGALMVLSMVLSMMLGVDTESNDLGSSDVAGVELSILVVVDQLGVFGHVERDDDGALLDLLGMDNLRISSGERRMKPNAGELVGKRKLDCGGSLRDGNAGDGVVLNLVTDEMAGIEERDAGNEKEGEENPDSPSDGAALPGLAVVVTVAEPGPEAAPGRGGADDELNVRLVDGVGVVGFLLDGIFGHEGDRKSVV